jgi:hypothetical protein
MGWTKFRAIFSQTHLVTLDWKTFSIAFEEFPDPGARFLEQWSCGIALGPT